MKIPFLTKRKTKLPHSNSEYERLVQLLKHHGITLVIDVGANTGQYGEKLRRCGYSGRIVSIEPGIHAYSLLLQVAHADPRWRVAPRMALGARPGPAQLRMNNRSDMDSLLDAKETTTKAFPHLRLTGNDCVDVARLDVVMDEVIAPTNSDKVFLKIDTQGYEYHVLEGADRVMDRILGLQVEMSLLPLYKGEVDYLSLLNYIQSLGFVPHLVIPGFFSRVLARQLQIDGIFFRDELRA